jgi:putative flavoprotein involved in K+ transport
MQFIDTIIIGAGQAGLSVARYLKESNIPFLILEKGSEIGLSWKDRYDSLVLDSYATYSELEGFPFLGDKKRQPTKDEVAEYLQSFAADIGLAPIFNTEVLSITKDGEEFIVTTNKDTYRSKSVVLATGPFTTPFIPPYAKKLRGDTYQIHTKDYKNASILPPGHVLIIGGGNSGSEIAKELIEHDREVLFSYKRKLKSVTSSPLTQWIAYGLGIAHIPQRSILGKLVKFYTQGKSIGMDVGKLLKNDKLISIGEIIDITKDGDIVTKETVLKDVGVVIWATGYQSDFSVINIASFNPKLQHRGVTNIKDLYVLNIRWQYSKSSSHLAGISRDAKYIAEQIAKKK